MFRAGGRVTDGEFARLRSVGRARERCGRGFLIKGNSGQGRLAYYLSERIAPVVCPYSSFECHQDRVASESVGSTGAKTRMLSRFNYADSVQSTPCIGGKLRTQRFITGAQRNIAA